jgi:transcriptional regulator with XRE-family HTH domain
VTPRTPNPECLAARVERYCARGFGYQARLAATAGIEASTVLRIRKGSDPSLSVAEALTAALDLLEPVPPIIIAPKGPDELPPGFEDADPDGGHGTAEQPLNRQGEIADMSKESNDTLDLLTTKEAAALLRLSPGTLATMRTRGGGPPFCKPKGAVRYRRSDLVAWVGGGFHAPLKSRKSYHTED